MSICIWIHDWAIKGVCFIPSFKRKTKQAAGNTQLEHAESRKFQSFQPQTSDVKLSQLNTNFHAICFLLLRPFQTSNQTFQLIGLHLFVIQSKILYVHSHAWTGPGFQSPHRTWKEKNTSGKVILITPLMWRYFILQSQITKKRKDEDRNRDMVLVIMK